MHIVLQMVVEEGEAVVAVDLVVVVDLELHPAMVVVAVGMQLLLLALAAVELATAMDVSSWLSKSCPTHEIACMLDCC